MEWGGFIVLQIAQRDFDIPFRLLESSLGGTIDLSRGVLGRLFDGLVLGLVLRLGDAAGEIRHIGSNGDSLAGRRTWQIKKNTGKR